VKKVWRYQRGNQNP